MKYETIKTEAQYIEVSATVATIKKAINAWAKANKTEKIAGRITAAVRNPNGKIPGLLNLVTALVVWPDDTGMNQAKAERHFGIDGDMAADLRMYKGFNSFVSEDGDIVTGVEQQTELYQLLLKMVANKVAPKAKLIDWKPTDWAENEATALSNCKTELEENANALADYEAQQ